MILKESPPLSRGILILVMPTDAPATMLAEAFSYPDTPGVDSFSAGTHSVWARVNAYAGADATGFVQQANEGDNIRGPVTFHDSVSRSAPIPLSH